jgi:hypothetical protein
MNAASRALQQALAMTAGVSVGHALEDGSPTLQQLLLQHQLRPGQDVRCHVHGDHTQVVLSPQRLAAWVPDHDTLSLQARMTALAVTSDPTAPSLATETLVALLASPVPQHFASVAALASAVRVRCNTAQAARRTALAFNTCAAERPASHWREDAQHGFVLQGHADLVDALIAATQPDASGKRYDFSCYRATEYVLLLGLAQELKAHNPNFYAALNARCQQQVIRSRQFHDVFLEELGSLDTPLPSHYHVPGDRVWFRNPDAASSDASGFEGSWVIYLGGGLFSNFWQPEAPYTLAAKCLEIFHWPDGLYIDGQGEPRIDEVRVAQCCAATREHTAQLAAAMERMMRMRDPQGVHAHGGCLDATREHLRCALPSSQAFVLPTLPGAASTPNT